MAEGIGKAGRCSEEYQTFVNSVQHTLMTIQDTPLGLPSCAEFKFDDLGFTASSRTKRGFEYRVTVRDNGNVIERDERYNFYKSYFNILDPQTVTRAKEVILSRPEKRGFFKRIFKPEK